MLTEDIKCSKRRFIELLEMIMYRRENSGFQSKVYMDREIDKYVRSRIVELDKRDYIRYRHKAHSLASRIYDEVKEKFLKDPSRRYVLCFKENQQ